MNADQETSTVVLPFHASNKKARRQEEENRRAILNLKERKRAMEINQKIRTLQELVQNAGMPVPTTKTGILRATAQYIRDLRSRIEEEEELNDLYRLVFKPEIDECEVQPSDYESVFRHSPTPMAVANTKGTVIDCNTAFLALANRTIEEAKSLAIFDLVVDGHQAELCRFIRTEAEKIPAAELVTQIKQEVFHADSQLMEGTGKVVSVSVVRNESGFPACLSIAIEQF